MLAKDTRLLDQTQGTLHYSQQSKQHNLSQFTPWFLYPEPYHGLEGCYSCSEFVSKLKKTLGLGNPLFNSKQEANLLFVSNRDMTSSLMVAHWKHNSGKCFSRKWSGLCVFDLLSYEISGRLRAVVDCLSQRSQVRSNECSLTLVPL